MVLAAAEMRPLAEVTVLAHGSVIVARLVGEVDLSNVDAVERTVVGPITDETRCLIVDLSETAYLDSAGVRLLFDLAVRLHAHGQQLRLVVSDATIVRRVLILTHLDQTVPFDASVEAALAATQ